MNETHAFIRSNNNNNMRLQQQQSIACHQPHQCLYLLQIASVVNHSSFNIAPHTPHDTHCTATSQTRCTNILKYARRLMFICLYVVKWFDLFHLIWFSRLARYINCAYVFINIFFYFRLFNDEMWSDCWSIWKKKWQSKN